MPLLVHIAPLAEAKKIRRNGIAPTTLKHARGGFDRFVWAFPVLESYTLTHQWSRELKRWGRTSLAAVTFRIGDAEPVLVRHYSREGQQLTAAEAAGLIRAQADPRGFEVMVPRRIAPGEIVRVRPLPIAVGWRYAPNLKNQPFAVCDCPVCLPRGEVRAARYRERVRAERRRLGLSPGD